MATLFLIIYILVALFGPLMAILNIGHLRAHGDAIPQGFEAIDQAKLAEANRYSIDKAAFGVVSTLYDKALTLVFLFGGLLGLYDRWILSLDLGFILSGLIFFLALTLASTVLSLPFSLYSTFRLERKFGFTTTTGRLWLTDLAKSLIISLILSGALISLGLWLVQASPDHWWIWVWLLFLLFGLLVMFISPYVIEPLFNKYTPVEDEHLRDDIQRLAEGAGFRAEKILSTDESRRSRHSNAYFTGLGRDKRIILFDTLLEKMEHQEILAILAHEMGHWKLRHVTKRIVASQVLSFIGLALAHRLLESDMLFRLVPLEGGSFFAQLVILAVAAQVALTPLTPLFTHISRRQERDADRYACRMISTPDPLASALVKLAKDNLSNLHPHPLFAAIYYSHPPVVERYRELMAFRGD